MTEVRQNISKLIEEITATNQYVQVFGKKGTIVMVSEKDWNAIQETLYLCSIPGMKGSIKKGLATPLSECSKKLKW